MEKQDMGEGNIGWHQSSLSTFGSWEIRNREQVLAFKSNHDAPHQP